MKKISFTALAVLLAFASFGQTGLTFMPDHTVKGSGLAGWHTLGQAAWQAQDGELSARVKGGSGWLVLDSAYQDVGFHALFRCSGNAEAGILFRMEKYAGGLRGVLVAVKGDTLASYKVTLDEQGRILQREKLRSIGGIDRLAPPADPHASVREANAAPPRRQPRPAGPVLPVERPETALHPGEWNQVEAFLDLNIIRVFINDGAPMGSVADTSAGNYGPLALYAGGNGEVRFKEIGYKDIAMKVTPLEKTSPRFREQCINDMYYSWGCAAADFNHDGYTDIVAGPYIYYGPSFTTYREIYPAFALNPSKEFTDVNCEYAYDFNGDGWPDVLTSPPNAVLYINPQGASRRWDKYEVVNGVQTEVTVFTDVDGDGKPELVYGKNGALYYAKPDPANPSAPWTEYLVSQKGYAMPHGLGAGDINGDGHVDIVNAYGWWEKPATGDEHTSWIYHPAALGRYGHRSTGIGGATMAVYDVNGDGLNDVVTSLNAHGFGLGWYEQKRDRNGEITFVQHIIMDDYATKNAGDVTFSELHGSTFADIDGDGTMDFIVGKRYWSHLDDYFDPDPYGPPVLYWYRTVRDASAAGGAKFVPELVNNRSGAGAMVLAVDLNKDGAVDIVTSTDRGTFIFWNEKGKQGK